MPLTPVCWQKPKPRGLQTLDFHSSESINVVVCISRLAAVFSLFNYKENFLMEKSLFRMGWPEKH